MSRLSQPRSYTRSARGVQVWSTPSASRGPELRDLPLSLSLISATDVLVRAKSRHTYGGGGTCDANVRRNGDPSLQRLQAWRDRFTSADRYDRACNAYLMVQRVYEHWTGKVFAAARAK